MNRLTRKESREQAFVILFEQAIQKKSIKEIVADAQEARDFSLSAFTEQLVFGTEAQASLITETIQKNLKGWSIHRLSKVTYSILQLSVYEILFEADIPVGVSINEAVELAKTYGDKEDAVYVNGVLSTVEKTADYEKSARGNA